MLTLSHAPFSILLLPVGRTEHLCCCSRGNYVVRDGGIVYSMAGGLSHVSFRPPFERLISLVLVYLSMLEMSHTEEVSAECEL